MAGLMLFQDISLKYLHIDYCYRVILFKSVYILMKIYNMIKRYFLLVSYENVKSYGYCAPSK
jgi:hypothetical protein